MVFVCCLCIELSIFGFWSIVKKVVVYDWLVGVEEEIDYGNVIIFRNINLMFVI